MALTPLMHHIASELVTSSQNIISNYTTEQNQQKQLTTIQSNFRAPW